MRTAVQLQATYDVTRLLRDLDIAVAHNDEHIHWSDYHDGGWSAIPLVSVEGRSDVEALRLDDGDFKKTPLLKKCEYFNEIVDAFNCGKRRVRIMRLKAGTNIATHHDPEDSWALGQVRLHIPIVTHPDVEFIADGERVVMAPGELWYCDFSRPHSVHNRSPIDRMHLVLDLELNSWLRSLFPEESTREQLDNFMYRQRYRLHSRLGKNLLYRSARELAQRVR